MTWSLGCCCRCCFMNCAPKSGAAQLVESVKSYYVIRSIKTHHKRSVTNAVLFTPAVGFERISLGTAFLSSPFFFGAASFLLDDSCMIIIPWCVYQYDRLWNQQLLSDRYSSGRQYSRSLLMFIIQICIHIFAFKFQMENKK